ncbi:hypothetical protein BJV74DRAFT_868467 [Russula compacta]|nr:hypothetical protein BJV74DRAFT_868467 [Russula compacta]
MSTEMRKAMHRMQWKRDSTRSSHKNDNDSCCEVLSEHMRKCLVHLEQATVRIATSSTSRPSAHVDPVTLGILAGRAAHPAYTTVLEDLFATTEQQMTLRLPAAVLCTTSMCSHSSSSGCAAISAIVCRASPALPPPHRHRSAPRICLGR